MKCPTCGHETQGGFCSICGRKAVPYDDERPTTLPPIERHVHMGFVVLTLLLIFFGLITLVSFQHQEMVQRLEARDAQLGIWVERSQREVMAERYETEQNAAQAHILSQETQLEDIERARELAEIEAALRVQVKEIERQEALRTVREVGISHGLDDDADSDGLLLSQERALGTRPYDPDTDDDGFLDGYDPTPTGGGRTLVVGVAGFRLSVHSDIFDYYRALPRSLSWSAHVHHREPYIRNLARDIVAEGAERNASKLGAIVEFVHDLAYVRDVNLGYDEYPKYPIETLVEGAGDCEDTSILLASLLKAVNLDAVLLVGPRHMAVGVPCSNPEGYLGVGTIKYCYLETTSSQDWLPGEIPPGINLLDFQVLYIP